MQVTANINNVPLTLTTLDVHDHSDGNQVYNVFRVRVSLLEIPVVLLQSPQVLSKE